MQIFDAHHHLWDLDHCEYPWLMARGEKRFFGDPTPIQKNYLPENLRQDAEAFELVGSTHIQVGVGVGDEVKETQWLQSLSDQGGLPTAIVAFCDLSLDDAHEQLAEQTKQPALRGIRHIVGRESEEDRKHDSHRLLENKAWRNNLKLLAELNLSFDLQLIPELHDRAFDAFSSAPELKVAVCHAGSPWDQTPEGIAAWKSGMSRLAKLPNMHCKLSGLGMFNPGWSAADTQVIFDTIYDLFGADRIMCGSNFPVDSLYGGYEQIWQNYREMSASLSEAERSRLFVENAKAFYNCP